VKKADQSDSSGHADSLPNRTKYRAFVKVPCPRGSPQSAFRLLRDDKIYLYSFRVPLFPLRLFCDIADEGQNLVGVGTQPGGDWDEWGLDGGHRLDEFFRLLGVTEGTREDGGDFGFVWLWLRQFVADFIQCVGDLF
jgi:hypothetical protein